MSDSSRIERVIEGFNALVDRERDAVHFAAVDEDAPWFEVHCEVHLVPQFEALLADVPHSVTGGPGPVPATSGEPPEAPKIVVLCGSTRFMDTFTEANVREALAGNIVLSVVAIEDRVNPLEPDVRRGLDELHLRKIDLADEVLVIDVDQYVGEATTREIAYAQSLGKPIRSYFDEVLSLLAGNEGVQPQVASGTPPFDLQAVADAYVRALMDDPTCPVNGGGPGWNDGAPCIELYVPAGCEWAGENEHRGLRILVIASDFQLENQATHRHGDATTSLEREAQQIALHVAELTAARRAGQAASARTLARLQDRVRPSAPQP